MTVDEYEKLPPQFNPVDFDPVEWVGIAKQAGMRYITITSKHHDGFAMWDSQVSDYNIVDATPYGKDVLKMLAEECERQGIKLFFYHSHLDWRHPDYFPRGKTGSHSARQNESDFNDYLDYMDAQVAELASGDYGQLAGFWFDGWWDQHTSEDDKADRSTHVDWRLQQTYDLIHRLQPQAIIGNNHHVLPFEGEGFQMFERDLPGENSAGFNTTAIGDLPLESCDTINGAWGYDASDQDFKSAKQLVHYLVRAAGFDANLLLNVGPTPMGTFQPEVIERLHAVGEWTSEFGETVYDTRGGPMAPQSWGVMTSTDDQLFVHVLDADSKQLILPGTAELDVQQAFVFGTEHTVALATGPGGEVAITVPESAINAIDTVIVLGL